MIDPAEILPPWREEVPWCLSDSVPGFGPGDEWYSTESFLLKERTGFERRRSPKQVLGLLRLEFAGEATKGFLEPVGLRAEPCSDDLIQAVRFHGARLEEAVAQISWIRESVTALARSVIPIASQGPDYDCSHSEPSLPFSVFLSVPSKDAKAGFLRFGESLIHETMHLQLSLFEKIAPVISPEGEEVLAFSPWRSENRPVRGVLHGLYVFYIVSKWYSALIHQGGMSAEERDFCSKRISDIGDEIGMVRRTRLWEGLTPIGIEFVKGMLPSVGPNAELC